MNPYLAEPFATLWAGKDIFACAERLEGEVYRELEGRRTLRTEVNGKGYFIKIHRGVGWREIIKNLLSLRLPILGASNEYIAIQRLQAANVDTMTACAYAKRGCNPAKQHSFIITEELAPTISLEDYCMDWPNNPPEPKLKRALITRVAQMVSAMHNAGVNHRDCYICHFLLHTDTEVTAEQFKLSVIDLHRAQARRKIPKRWRDKDLSGLYYSVLDIGLTERDKLLFLKAYFGLPLRDILEKEVRLIAWIQHKADKMYQRQQRYCNTL